MARGGRRLGVLLLFAAWAASPATAGAQAEPVALWEAWARLDGVFDVVGPMSGDRLVLAGAAGLAVLEPGGVVSPLSPPPGFVPWPVGSEAYIAASPGLHVAGAGCDFPAGELYGLQTGTPGAVQRITATFARPGFATVKGVEGLNGIAFDTTGRFGHRLLVSGPSHGRTVVAAIDCRGDTEIITRDAPPLEGGLAVAPAGFGRYGGDLIAPDELSGAILAIDPSGRSEVIAGSGLPAGGDIGVEGVGFVPRGFQNGFVYFADRVSPGNPHPGTDHLLRLPGAALLAAGVKAGDLLAATEGGAGVVSVRCGLTCQVTQVVAATPAAHGEGHLLVVPGGPGAIDPGESARQLTVASVSRGILVLATAGLLLLTATALVIFLRRRRRRGPRGARPPDSHPR